MAKNTDKQRRYQGRITSSTPRDALVSTRCASCYWPTINGDQWCYACKDPEGFSARLAVAQADALHRLAEAYPTHTIEQMALWETP